MHSTQSLAHVHAMSSSTDGLYVSLTRSTDLVCHSKILAKQVGTSTSVISCLGVMQLACVLAQII